MPASLPELDPAVQRQLAAGLFNLVWKYLEKPDRTPEEAEAMLHAAHASRHHWTGIGTPVQSARGEWQLARVYAVLRRPEPSAHHARRCLELCDQNGIGGFDLGFAHEALARASAVAGDSAARDLHATLAARCAAQIEDAEDREWLEQNLKTLA